MIDFKRLWEKPRESEWVEWPDWYLFLDPSAVDVSCPDPDITWSDVLFAGGPEADLQAAHDEYWAEQMEIAQRHRYRHESLEEAHLRIQEVEIAAWRAAVDAAIAKRAERVRLWAMRQGGRR